MSDHLSASGESPAELLHLAEHYGRQTRRAIHNANAWALAAVFGAALVATAGLGVLGASLLVQAFVLSALMVLVCLVAAALWTRSRSRFGVGPPVEFAWGLPAGLAAAALLILMTGGRPPRLGFALIAAGALALAGIGIAWLRVPMLGLSSAFCGCAVTAIGVLLALGAVVAPHSYTPRRLLAGVGLLAIAALAKRRSEAVA